MDPQQLDILKHLQTQQRAELEYRRRREVQVFAWSATLLLAIAGGVLGRDSSSVLGREELSWRWVGSLVVAVLAFFSTNWQKHHRTAGAAHKKVLVKIARELGAYSPAKLISGCALYPKEWTKWGQDVRSRGRVSATVLVAAVVLLSIWWEVLQAGI